RSGSKQYSPKHLQTPTFTRCGRRSHELEDPGWSRAAQEYNRERTAQPPIEDARPPAFSDEALALRFAHRHGGEVRYVAAWGRWLLWDGRRWLFDDTLYAYDLARRVCREVAAECNNAKVASSVAAAKTVLQHTRRRHRPTQRR